MGPMNAMLWEDVAHDPTDIQCKHTRCSWSVYSECCATHVAAYFPHISVGCSFGNRWHLFSAPLLVQRLLVQKVAFSKTTLCVSFNTLPMAKPIPFRPLVQRLKHLSSVIHQWTRVHWWMDLVSPQRMAQAAVKEDPPEHLSISKSHILSPPS